MADGKVIFAIEGDDSGIISTLKTTTDHIQKAGQDWSKEATGASDNIGTALINGFKMVTASAAFMQISKMLISLGLESIDLASSLEEVQNRVEVVFGAEGAKEVDRWSKGMRDNFGLTELQAKSYSSTMGAMLRSSGVAEDMVLTTSKRVTELVADMTSFYDIPFDEMFQKIMSGLSGEIEPLRRLGINIGATNIQMWMASKGMKEDFAKLSQGEQILIRYAYLLEATADAEGDFARTNDSYANSQRRLGAVVEELKVELGKELLPIATDITNAVTDLLDLLLYKPPENAITEAAEAMGEAAAEAAQAQGILGYMERLYQQYGEAATKSSEWADALDRLKTIMPDINEFINKETGALKLTNEQLREYIENRKQVALSEAKTAAIAKAQQNLTDAEMGYYEAEVKRDMALSEADEAARGLMQYIVTESARIAKETGDEDYWEDPYTVEGLYADYKAGKYDFGKLYEVAKTFGSDELIKGYKKVYEEQTKEAEKQQQSMVDYAKKVDEASVALDIATQALARLEAAAGGAAAALSAGGGHTSNMHLGRIEGEYATGLDYVPSDGFIASLHKGEGILTAEENKLWHSLLGNRGMSQNIDYGTLGAAMWDNAPRMGGNVYLDGRTVGRVISERQANAYRALERSGWQA